MVTASGEVPPPLLFFTCLVCTGVMANFTLLVPVSTYYSATLLESGVIVSSYAGGAIVSLYFWSTYDRRAVRPAYVLQACLMCAGNGLFAACSALSAALAPTPRTAFFVVALCQRAVEASLVLAASAFGLKTRSVPGIHVPRILDLNGDTLPDVVHTYGCDPDSEVGAVRWEVRFGVCTPGS